MTSRLRYASLALAVACLALSATGSASAATLPAGTTAILSGNSLLSAPLPAPVSSSETASSAVSQDGRFVAFQSRSDGLYEGDDDRVSNVYVRDRESGAVILASRATGVNGEPAHDWCYQPSISDNGARVAFTCEGPLDPVLDKNGPATDVYVRDLSSNITHLASRAGGGGAVGDRASSNPVLSETGEFVAFESESTNLDQGVTTARNRVYRHRIDGTPTTVLVSRRDGAAGAPAEAHSASISDNGNVIAFTSMPLEKIDTADTNDFADVYVRDVSAGVTILASRKDGAGEVGNGNSGSPAIAGNGGSVAFESRANQFDFDNDSDTGPDIYRRSLTAKTTALVSINAAGQKGNISTRPSVDDSGDVVAFVSSATTLDPDDADPTRDAYVKNLITNKIQVASRTDGPGGVVANAGAAAVAVSGDGTKVGIGLDGGSIAPGLDPHHSTVVLRELDAPNHTDPIARPAGTEPFVNEGGFADGGALSADGRYSAFYSDAPGLGLPADARLGVFVRDRVTGAVTLASRADGVSGAPLPAGNDVPAISADGRRVAFTVWDGEHRGVYVRDIAAGRTFLASRADGPAGDPGNGESSSPSLDADGSRVVFVSTATNLGDGDTDSLDDIHLRDLDTGRTILVSRGADGAKGNGESSVPDVNADGTHVAFVSYSSNLGDGDADVKPDAHLRDLTTDTTLLVSATAEGTKSDGFVQRLSIDASGERVAFDAVSTTLPGGTLGGMQVYVRDFAPGGLVLASRADGPDGAPGSQGSAGPVISPDGGHVAFASEAPNLGAPEGTYLTFVRDLAGGRTELVSRASGPDGRPATGVASPFGVSTGADCVSFVAEDALAGAYSEYRQVYLRVRRADCGMESIDPRDTSAPVLSGARLTRKRFRVGSARTPLAAKLRRGTVLRFRSSEAGTASVKFAREVRGRRGRVKLRAAGRITRKVGAGTARIALSGRLGRRPMRAGRYRLTLQVRDAAGNASRPVRLRFRVAR